MPTSKRRRDHPPPRTGPGEKEVLLGFLDYLRAAVVATTEGVPEPQVRTSAVASGTTLLGLVKHLTSVERHWVLGKPVADWQATFRPEPRESAADLVRAYQDTTAEVNAVIAASPDLAAPGPKASLRWTLTHLIEETGRHAGHADILRELIDGATGR